MARFFGQNESLLPPQPAGSIDGCLGGDLRTLQEDENLTVSLDVSCTSLEGVVMKCDWS